MYRLREGHAIQEDARLPVVPEEEPVCEPEMRQLRQGFQASSQPSRCLPTTNRHQEEARPYLWQAMQRQGVKVLFVVWADGWHQMA
jgi:hypothetical protein